MSEIKKIPNSVKTYINKLRKYQETAAKHPNRRSDLVQKSLQATDRQQNKLQQYGLSAGTATGLTSDITLNTFPKGQTFNFVTNYYAVMVPENGGYYLDFVNPQGSTQRGYPNGINKISVVFYRNGFPNVSYSEINQLDGNGPLVATSMNDLTGNPFYRVTGFTQSMVDNLVNTGYVIQTGVGYKLAKDAEVFD